MALVSICFERLSTCHILHLKDTRREILETKPHKTCMLSKSKEIRGKWGKTWEPVSFCNPWRIWVQIPLVRIPWSFAVFRKQKHFCEEILQEITHWISRIGKGLQQKETYHCKLAANQVLLVLVAWLANFFASLRDTHHRSQNHFSERSAKIVHFFLQNFADQVVHRNIQTSTRVNESFRCVWCDHGGFTSEERKPFF